MSSLVPFHDLVGPDRELTVAEDFWLTKLVNETDPAQLTIKLGDSVIGSEPGPIVERTVMGWRAGRYIGELRRDGVTLQIQPRLDLAVIAGWASAILNVRIVPRAAEHSGGMRALIAELVAAAWRASLVDAARHGPPGFRGNRSHVGSDVRGRLDVQGSVPLRAARLPVVKSVSRPKQVNNPVTRAIVTADRILDRRIGRPDWRGDRVEELMPRLRAAVGARPAPPTIRELAAVRYTPITLPYRRTADLSWQIIRNRGLRTAATAEKADGLLIDVAELWELFLLHCARRAFTEPVTHGTRLRSTRPLLRSAKRPDLVRGRLYPDILIGSVDAPAALIDAKYKPLADPRGVDREDLYQLAAYMVGFDSEPKAQGMLGYTNFSDPVRSANPSDETNSPWRSASGHLVRFKRLPVSEKQCIEALRAAFSEDRT